jgi:hypothetical protein
VLGHAIAGVEGVYDGHHYAVSLAHLVETIVNPPKDNVVGIAGRRRKKR